MKKRQFLVALSVVAASATGAARADADQSKPFVVATCALAQLPGLSAQYARATKGTISVRAPELQSTADALSTPAGAGAMSPAAASDFWLVAASVLRLQDGHDHTDAAGRPVVDAVGYPSLASLPCDAAVRTRDSTAWSMGLVGYSAREIADVIDGHLTRAALDRAYALAMTGAPRENVAAFLESKWREPARAQVASASAVARCSSPGTRLSGVTSDLTQEISSLAERHRVSPALIQAVIAAESSGNACALSPAGAVGLMQLMPATAAALGVDPWQPLQNLRGGVAYLASLLRAYGEDVRLALIAYNAGPQHADRVKAGQAVAYRETRRYLDAVAGRYPIW